MKLDAHIHKLKHFFKYQSINCSLNGIKVEIYHISNILTKHVEPNIWN